MRRPAYPKGRSERGGLEAGDYLKRSEREETAQSAGK